MKKAFTFIAVCMLTLGLFTGCSSQNNGDAFNLENEIHVISREPGSGTRGAFIELLGIEQKGADGSKVDKTTPEATVINKTDVMLTTVAGDINAIGYVSLGSLNSSVKALQIDGAAANTENIKNNSYQVFRPFYIATKGDPTGLAKDFIDFILSAEGQNIVSESYIKIDESAPAFAGTKPAGKIVVTGSSSVTPVMESLQEAYRKINPNATIEVQQTDSSSGLQAAAEGTCDIGMASRDLKDSEKETLKDTKIALDGVAVIVNPKNTMTNLTTDQAKKIFTGEYTKWSQAK